MNYRDLIKLLIVPCMVLLISAGVFAQNDTAAPAAPQQAEAMGENDRLPFMQHEESAPTQDPGSGSLLIKTLGSMLLIVGLIFAGAWVARKLGYGKAKAEAEAIGLDLTMINSISLGNGRTISSLKFGDRILVVGSTPQSFTLLAEDAMADEMEEEAVRFQHPRSVAEMLAEENNTFESAFEKVMGLQTNDGGRS